jgi:chaperonin cofactor prefoldin
MEFVKEIWDSVTPFFPWHQKELLEKESTKLSSETQRLCHELKALQANITSTNVLMRQVKKES